eukprot:2220540-Pleurochrysis_carterae.AAC.1
MIDVLHAWQSSLRLRGRSVAQLRRRLPCASGVDAVGRVRLVLQRWSGTAFAWRSTGVALTLALSLA